MASPTGGSAPWTPDGVPPLSIALRGGSPLHSARGSRHWLDVDVERGDRKMGSGAYGPGGVQGQSRWP